MKYALIAALSCGALRTQTQTSNPALIVELHDDGIEEVTFQNIGPAPAELRAVVMAAAGCLPGTQSGEPRGGNQTKLTCRRMVERSGPAIAASWDFSPLASSLSAARLSAAGATQLTTCINHPDWPYSENDQGLPVQRIPGRIAYCGAWTVRDAGPLRMRVKAGYEANSVRTLGWAALALTLLAGAAGRLLPGKGFLQRHTLTMLWAASCFGWMAIALQCDGLRMLSLWLGPAGDSRWLGAGILASMPVLALAVVFSFRREPILSKALRRRALLALAAFVFITAMLCGGPQSGPLTLLRYAFGVLVFMIAVRTGGSKSRLIPVKRGDLLAALERLANRAHIRAPQLFLWLTPADSGSGAAAVIGRRKLILVSAKLLSVCSKRETDAVVAHELAHFVQHRRVIVFVFVVAMMTILIWAASVEQRLQVWAVPPVIACMLLTSAWRRRLEFAADRFSAELTGDPGSMGAALVKIGSLNRTPVSGSALRELFLSHPWTEKRLQRLGVRLEMAESSPGDSGYAIEAEASEEAFNRPMALHLRGLEGYGQFLLVRIWAVALMSAACVWLSTPALSGLVFIAAASIGFFAISALWRRRIVQLARQVRARLLDLYGPVWAEPPLVGMSPGLGRTVFDSGYDWDVGMVRVSNSALCYAGDRAAFTLSRSAIRQIELRPGPATGWLRGRVICIYLSGVSESIALRLGPGGRDLANRRRTLELFEALRKWFDGDGPADMWECGFPSIEQANWPQGAIAVKRILSVRDFFRYVLSSVALVSMTSCVIWGWNLNPQTILAPAVTLALVTLFLGRAAVFRAETLTAPRK